jgi:DNA-binding CsgD family transcriptional regulator
MDDSHSTGALLTGARGVGKTRLAAEALSRCDRMEARWTVATPAGRAVPLGAFADWVPDGVENPTHATERVIARLVGAAAPGSVVVVVDDVHLLDDASAFLLQRFVDRRLGRLMLTARTGADLPDAVAALRRASALQRVELGPLGRQESTALLAATLGGTVDPVVSQRLWTTTQGNVRYLRAIVEHHVGAGQLRRDDGMWRWCSEPVVPDAVCELVEADMGRLSDEVAEALDLLAVARHLPARALVDLVGSGPIEEAERRSLIFADDAPEPVVRLVHPLYGEVRRTRMGRIRLRRLRGTVAGVLCDEDEPSPAELVRRGQLLIDSDVKPALDDLLTLAQAALWCGEFDVSLRFARRALLSGGGWKASIGCADALTMAGRSAEADAHLVGLDVDDLPPEGVKQLARARALSLLTQNRIPDALASVTGIDDSGEVDAVRALVLACAGRDSAAVAAADGALGTTGEPEPTTILAVVAKLLVVGERGDVAAVEEWVGGAADIATGSGTTSFARFLLAEAHALALALSGSYQAAERVIDRIRMDDAPPDLASWAAMMSGAIEVAGGSVGSGVSQIWSETTSARLGLLGGWLRRYQYDLAIGLAARGESDAAERALRRVGSASHPLGSYLEPIEAVAKAWISASTGAMSTAIGHARAGARSARDRQRWAREVWCLQAATRFGDRTTAARLAELAGVVKGPLAGVAQVHAAALATGDGDGLLEVSRRYEELGDLLSAVDTAVQAAAELRRADRRGTAFGAVRRSRELAEKCGAPHTPAMAIADAPPEFTGREREVIMLAAKGLTNHEIAERLHLSVRTVEGHLYRAAGRVGARNRGELARTICDDLGNTG